jgi:hypothetical protein
MDRCGSQLYGVPHLYKNWTYVGCEGDVSLMVDCVTGFW